MSIPISQLVDGLRRERLAEERELLKRAAQEERQGRKPSADGVLTRIFDDAFGNDVQREIIAATKLKAQRALTGDVPSYVAVREAILDGLTGIDERALKKSIPNDGRNSLRLIVGRAAHACCKRSLQ